MDNLITLPIILNSSFGLLALFSAIAMVIYKKNFPLHNGIASLFFFVGIISVSSVFISLYDNVYSVKLYLVSRCMIPILLFIFSEYILKIYYSISIKLLILFSTVVLGSIAFFQRDLDNLYEVVLNYYWIVSALIIFVHVILTLQRKPGLFTRRNLIIANLFCLAILANIVFKQMEISPITGLMDGLLAFVITHVIILIIGSAGINELRVLLEKVFAILTLSVLLPLLLKLLYPEIQQEYLLTLCILSATIFSLIYVVGELINNPKEMRNVKLISRLLSIPLQDRSRFVEGINEWEEVEKLHVIQHDSIEGEVDKFDLLFEKVGFVIHKYQLPELKKILESDPDYKIGIEVAEFYFKKYQCNSLYQLALRGDLMTLKYIDGLNPALFSNEISLMSRIVSSISNKEKEQ